MNVLQAFFAWLRANLVSLLLALLLSITVWVVAAQDENPPVEFGLTSPIPIDVVGLDEDLVIRNDIPESTRVRLRALQNRVPSISQGDVAAIVDLSGLGPGIHLVTLQLDVSTQAIVVGANPATLRVEIERRRVREMPVQVEVSGLLPPGYAFDRDSIGVRPAQVVLSGPESLVNLVSEVRVNADVEGLRGPLMTELPLQVIGADGAVIEGLNIEPWQVAVDVPIEQEAGYREVTIRVPVVGRPATGYYTSSRVVSPPFVTLRGDPTIIENLAPLINTEPVDLSDLTDDLLIEVALVLPPGVTAVETSVVQVLITIAAQQDSRSVILPVQISGLAENLQAQIEPETIEVFISGPLPVLQNLDLSSDLVVILDLNGYGPGTHSIEPVIQVSDSTVSIDSTLPTLIEVVITRR